MALLPPPDIGAAYVDDMRRPSKDFYNWIKSLYDATSGLFGGPAPLSYTEGTWTPVLSFGGASIGITYVTQAGSYVKLGKLVHIQAQIFVNSNGTSTGSAAVSGLPSANHATIPAILSVYLDNAAGPGAESGYFYGEVVANTATVSLHLDFDGDKNDVNEGNIPDGATIVISGTYMATV